MVKSRPLGLLLVILSSLTAFSPLSIDMYLPSFPQIAAEFGTTVARVELSLATFFAAAYRSGNCFTARRPVRQKKPLYVGLTIY